MSTVKPSFVLLSKMLPADAVPERERERDRAKRASGHLRPQGCAATPGSGGNNLSHSYLFKVSFSVGDAARTGHPDSLSTSTAAERGGWVVHT